LDLDLGLQLMLQLGPWGSLDPPCGKLLRLKHVYSDWNEEF
jgi:hypothetical protein